MKNKLFAVVIALLVALCASLAVACDKEPPDEEPPAPEYTTLTTEEFSSGTQSLTVIENYLNVLGYKFDINVKTEDASVATDTTLSVIFDMSVLEDVSVSVSLTNKTTVPISGEPAVTETEANMYLYSQTLYVDYTVDGVTAKDSMTGVNNDLTEVLSQLVTDTATSQTADTGIPMDTTELEEIKEYFKDYLTITYCAELGHYILDLDYSQGGVYQGETIDPFTCKVDLYVKNGRAASIGIDFDSADIKIDGTLAEYSGDIEYPENPTSYQGELLDSFELIYTNRNLPESAFYGSWTSAIGDAALTISEESVTITGSETEESYSDFYSYSVLMVVGDGYVLMLYPEDEMLITINIASGESDVFTKVAE